MEKTKKSNKYASAEQKFRLIQLVEADAELRSGKFSSTFTKNEAKKRWIGIAEELNSITGAKKTWEEWRKTWQDRKANAKKKFALLRRQSNLTGGGPPPDSPTPEESLVINTFDQQSLIGHTDSQESAVTIIDTSNLGNLEAEHATPTIDFSNPDNSSREDATPTIDLSHPDTEHIDTETQQSLPRVTGRKKRSVAQRRLQEGLNAARVLNKTMEEKNAIKKKFYEEYVKLKAQQVKALQDIAAALNKDNK